MPYKELIHGLSLAGVQVDRKMMADMAVTDLKAWRARHRRPWRVGYEGDQRTGQVAISIAISAQARRQRRFPIGSRLRRLACLHHVARLEAGR